jgi:hypothetical protein
MVEAVLVTITAIDAQHPDEGKRTREWQKLAEKAGVEIVENPAIAAARRDRMLAAVEEEFGVDG